ncbi:MAG: hypothetical protein H6559_28070 [Lewinellaceae bacterium]|nr:hypothetical protein [Lewinellaceae bacterium]
MLKRFTLLAWHACLLSQIAIAQNEQKLHHLSSFETGIEAAAETVAIRPGDQPRFFHQ